MHRIASLFAGSTEILCGLGLGPRIVDSLELMAGSLHPSQSGEFAGHLSHAWRRL